MLFFERVGDAKTGSNDRPVDRIKRNRALIIKNLGSTVAYI